MTSSIVPGAPAPSASYLLNLSAEMRIALGSLKALLTETGALSGVEAVTAQASFAKLDDVAVRLLALASAPAESVPKEHQLGPYIPTTIAQALDEQTKVLWTAICTMNTLLIALDYQEPDDTFDARSVLEGIRNLADSVHAAIEPMAIARRAAAIEVERASEVQS